MLNAFSQVEIVASCNNGTDTLDALLTLKPDLAIVDIKMPGLSGIEVLSEIRKQNKTLKFIILTLFSTGHYRQLAADAGVDYFFSKSDDFEKISRVMKKLLKELLINETI